jgi:hypothetical protein
VFDAVSLASLDGANVLRLNLSILSLRVFERNFATFPPLIY